MRQVPRGRQILPLLKIEIINHLACNKPTIRESNLALSAFKVRLGSFSVPKDGTNFLFSREVGHKEENLVDKCSKTIP